MKTLYCLLSPLLPFLIVALFYSGAYAETIEYRCDQQVGCIDQRVNFGAVQIKCTDVNGDILSDWVCEYEIEYSCRNRLTGEVRTGGFDPLADSLCDKLCGPCKNGWKENHQSP